MTPGWPGPTRGRRAGTWGGASPRPPPPPAPPPWSRSAAAPSGDGTRPGARAGGAGWTSLLAPAPPESPPAPPCGLLTPGLTSFSWRWATPAPPRPHCCCCCCRWRPPPPTELWAESEQRWMRKTCHGDVLLASTNLIKDKQPEIRDPSPGCWCHCIRSKTESNVGAIKNRHRLRDWDPWLIRTHTFGNTHRQTTFSPDANTEGKGNISDESERVPTNPNKTNELDIRICEPSRIRAWWDYHHNDLVTALMLSAAEYTNVYPGWHGH